jgi:hypothetical protein
VLSIENASHFSGQTFTEKSFINDNYFHDLKVSLVLETIQKKFNIQIETTEEII